MIFRRATATVLISMGVAAAFLQACSASPPGNSDTTGRTGSGTGNGNATTSGGTGGSTGSGGSTGGGATTGTGGGPPPINPGNPDATSDMRVGADASCANSATDGQKKPTDLLVMMDSSGSMNEMDMGQTGTRMDNLRMAMPGFINDPANTGMMIGLDFFPQGGNQGCNVMDYTTPDVPIAALPGNAMPFLTAVNARMPANGTPTGPALTGAIQTARTFQNANPDRSINVLLMTDGEPTGCGVQMANPTAQAAAAAQAGTMGMPPIKTYVLGVGPNTGNLDAIAAAGGTMKAYMATSGGAADLSKVLADIRKSTLTCEYNLPKPEAGMLDPGKVNVQVRQGPPPAMLVDILNVGDAGGCAIDLVRNPKGEGWYYDNSAAPTKIILCPNTCTPLQMADGSGVSVLLGCQTKPIPPPN
jgi:hypothetical protein